MASMTTSLCAAIGCSGWNGCAPPLMVRRCRHGSRRRFCANCSDWSLFWDKTIEAERDAIASPKTEVEHTNAKKIQDLAKIKSIGPEFATTLIGEVLYRSFDNRKQLASY